MSPVPGGRRSWLLGCVARIDDGQDMHASRLLTATVLALVAAVEACAAPPTVTADPRYELHVENGTTVPVSIVINGRTLAQVKGQSSTVVSLAREPPGTVAIQAQLPDGRPAISFVIDPATLSSETVGSVTDVVGAAHRADLSCGRLDLWLLTPLLGPPPGPGAAGDCGPMTSPS